MVKLGEKPEGGGGGGGGGDGVGRGVDEKTGWLLLGDLEYICRGRTHVHPGNVAEMSTGEKLELTENTGRNK